VRINQVLDNMLDNAFKYTSHGSVEFGYRLLVEDKRKYIDFYVKDSGSGISVQNQEMIFDRFAQIDSNYMGSVGGNGLGLSISRSIARLMNGDIRVDSHEGKGSVFHFITPYIPFELTDFSLDEPKFDWAKNLMQWPDKLVLIAEDEDSNYKLLEIMLRKTQVKLYRAYNGKQAVDYVVGGNDVDLVLMDVRMPVMNGYEATRGIKEFNIGLPVVIQTAFAQSGDREDCFGAGCDAYLSKPIKATELYKLMKKFLT
jgi:CheY-like chemotaxis protein